MIINLCVYVCECMSCVSGFSKDQMKILDALELELQASTNPLNECWKPNYFSGRAARDFNHLAISAVPLVGLVFDPSRKQTKTNYSYFFIVSSTNPVLVSRLEFEPVTSV